MHIRDKYGKVIGSIVESCGYQKAYDYAGRFVGKYDHRDNKTYDAYGSYYGDGNLLSMLL